VSLGCFGIQASPDGDDAHDLLECAGRARLEGDDGAFTPFLNPATLRIPYATLPAGHPPRQRFYPAPLPASLGFRKAALLATCLS
jgi:hypothetical protein